MLHFSNVSDLENEINRELIKSFYISLHDVSKNSVPIFLKLYIEYQLSRRNVTAANFILPRRTIDVSVFMGKIDMWGFPKLVATCSCSTE